MENIKSVVYSRNTVEFVTVAAEFCAYMEKSETVKCKDFVDTVLKLLPLLYLKASMLEKVESDEEFLPEAFVTEHDYEFIRYTLAGIMGDNDSYLDFADEEVRYNDEAVVRTVSEDLADIYQALRNFTETYRLGVENNMYEAVGAVTEAFELYWGKSLVNAMKAMHKVKYMHNDNDDNPEEEEDLMTDGF